jgi:nitroimidazol reductase NimA-like FMN-containing flavoprotein (pyridoxamine 5'-phosphate oxidase superfamily)
MSEDVLGPGRHTWVRRLPEKARYDAEVINAILDEARICHVAALVDGRAVTLPTLHAREGRTLYLHGNLSNAFMKAVFSSAQAYVNVTIYDGLRLARSGFESSIAYRSVVVMGPATKVSDPEEKRRVLDLFVDAILPGRSKEGVP